MRTRQRGFTGIEIIGLIVAAAALIGAIGGVVHLATSYLDSVRAEAKQAGRDECDAAYKVRDNEALADARAEIIRLNKQYRELEQASAKRINQLAGELAKEKARDKEAADRMLDDLDSGALVLRDGIVQIAACPAAEGPAGAGPQVAAGAFGGGGKTCYRLAREVEKSLVAIASAGDANGRQLAACLAIAEEDRKTVNFQ